ncbi:nitrate- and nitrite sensing domain-containing protein [Saccharopolyspora hirsuta]|uniref:histidine kinase n=1 Tax=Saccharopolyspora hirsuta TaxID=1837 RepID=A0A5M7C755_SACHI|nr:nitrate- and nitrite sensing domain-containing protein [Saccharopolyspora hirsuta]KAA5838156.1 sensor histidine kinase [Saccharopolyspora hirsuta]
MEVTTQNESLAPPEKRRGRRAGQEKNSIRSRLTWSVVIPWIVVFILWAVGCALFAFEAIYTQQVATSVRQMSLPAMAALEEVKKERLLTLETVDGPGRNPAELLDQQRRTDRAVNDMNRTAAGLLDSAPEEIRRSMTDLTDQLDRMEGVRSRVTSGQISYAEVVDFYDTLFDTATRMADVQAKLTLDPETRQGAIAATDLLRASDLFSRETSLVGTVLDTRQLSPEQHRELTRYIDSYHSTLEQNASSMRPAVHDRYQKLLTSPSWQQLVAAEDRLIGSPGLDSGDALPIGLEEWRRISDEVGTELSAMVTAQADEVSAVAVESGNDALWTVLWGSLAALVVALVSFVYARRVYRTVVDEALLTRLQGLRTESLVMANKLPEVVRRLREGEPVDVKTEMSALENYGNDEVGQVAQALQLFQRQAMDAAVGETRARQGARVVFVGMAHRIQRLLRQMHGTIDQLEKNEESSAQLAKLFELDNSTTRARRTVENLLVLGDQQPGRRWSRPVALMDVLRSSISEIDQYSRVVIGHVPKVMVNGAAVGDTIHLISELIDNATAFSPPNTQVQVDVKEVARGVAIDIADQGLGMSEETRERANEMMSTPPEFDRLVLESNKAEQLGLFTAARLAHRRDIAVEFGVSAYGGTRATVLLPDRLLDADTSLTTSNGSGPLSPPAAPADRSGGGHDLAAVPQPRELSWNGVMTDQPDPAAAAPAETAYEWPQSDPAPEPAADPAAVQEEQRKPKSGRPPLPKRVPQANLADGLRDDPDQEEQGVVASPSKLAGFRRAFRGGSGDAPDDRA